MSAVSRFLILDIGGEGRHAAAWNLNPRTFRTCGPRRGQPIPNLIHARADRIPLADHSVDALLVERTPLSRLALDEIKRVVKPCARIILRHAISGVTDPHRLALQVLAGTARRSETSIGRTRVMQTVVRLRD